jgi:hypothetical protein
MVETPQGCLEYAPKYKVRAWEAYTLSELGQWVHLLTTRAGHRSDFAKRDKDLHDAKNYLAMMQSRLEEESLLCLENFASFILDELSGIDDITVVGKPVKSTCHIDWKVPNEGGPKCFADMHFTYVEPAVMSVKQTLTSIREVCSFVNEPCGYSNGELVQVAESGTMSLRLRTRYDSDFANGGKDAGTVMSIEIGLPH